MTWPAGAGTAIRWGGGIVVKIVVYAVDPLSRAGLVDFIGKDPGVQLVEDWAESDVVVVVADRLVGEVVSSLRRQAAIGKPVVLVVDELHDDELLTAIGCGVAAVLPRQALTGQSLERCLSTVLAGGAILPPQLVGALLKHINRIHSDVLTSKGLDASGLSTREIEVLRLVADGRTTSEIAVELRCAERTVKNILFDVNHRLNLKNRAHAVAFALRKGVI
jgi:DNA-binding NarL/FixJ family response regulator